MQRVTEERGFFRPAIRYQRAESGVGRGAVQPAMSRTRCRCCRRKVRAASPVPGLPPSHADSHTDTSALRLSGPRRSKKSKDVIPEGVIFPWKSGSRVRSALALHRWIPMKYAITRIYRCTVSIRKTLLIFTYIT